MFWYDLNSIKQFLMNKLYILLSNSSSKKKKSQIKMKQNIPPWSWIQRYIIPIEKRDETRKVKRLGWNIIKEGKKTTKQKRKKKMKWRQARFHCYSSVKTLERVSKKPVQFRRSPKRYRPSRSSLHLTVDHQWDPHMHAQSYHSSLKKFLFLLLLLIIKSNFLSFKICEGTSFFSKSRLIFN